MLVSLTIFSIGSNSFAGQTVELLKDQPAPYDGVLFDKDAANQTRKKLIEGEGQKEINTHLQKKIELQDLSLGYREKQVELLSGQNEKLSERLDKTTNTSNWERILWFSLGVIGTGLAIRGATQLNK